MHRQRRIKRKRKIKEELKYSDSDLRRMILEFFLERLNPAKGGFFEIIYNNTIPFLDGWINKHKK